MAAAAHMAHRGMDDTLVAEALHLRTDPTDRTDPANGPLHELLRTIRRTPDRLLHARRRAAALATVRDTNPPWRLLVLCHGNICRSPFAAALLQRELHGAGVVVESAGFVGPGRPSPTEAQRAASHHDVNLSGHRSHLITPEVVRSADLVLAMDQRQARAVVTTYGKPRGRVLLLGDFDPQPVSTRSITDPINESAAVYHLVYARIERCVHALAAALSGAPARPGGP
jgi:low molecular weight protein-tyrosine phosphatase